MLRNLPRALALPLAHYHGSHGAITVCLKNGRLRRHTNHGGVQTKYFDNVRTGWQLYINRQRKVLCLDLAKPPVFA